MIKTAKHPPNNIRQLRRQRDMTMDDLAQKLGTSASTINKLEKSKVGLGEHWVRRIAEVFDVTTDQVLMVDGMDPGYDALVTTPDGRTIAVEAKAKAADRELRVADLDLPMRGSLPLDLPVYGTAAGSHLRGAFQMEPGNVVDHVRRPPALLGAASAYALYIEGASMIPEHNPGDLRIVHPGRPPRVGDSVIVQTKLVNDGEVEATIGHYLRKTPTQLVIGKLNPPSEVSIKLETVVAVHKVLTVNDLFGV